METLNEINRWRLSFELEDYSNYINVIEEVIKTRKRRLLNMLENSTKDFTDPQGKQGYFDYVYFDDYNALAEIYACILSK